MKENKSFKDISEYLEQVEYVKEKVNFLLQEIPDVKVKLYDNAISFYPKFGAKSVSQNYTGLDFVTNYDSLSVKPYRLVEFTYKGKTEKITVNSNPGSSRLAYVTRRYDSYGGITNYCINFSKMTVNFQNNNFSDSMLNSCRVKILDFMKKYPKHKLNTKHMDLKLKNLMAFV